MIPHSEQFDDIYFAVEDGLAESRYVYLEKNNLPALWTDAPSREQFVIAETGFGTGLNFLCAWTLFEQTAAAHQKLHYYSVEKFPLSADDIRTYLSHWAPEFGGRLERLASLYPLRIGGWHTLELSPQVSLTLMFDDANRALPELQTPVDCWFLDGHAPAKNPDMWSDTVFRSVGRLSRKGSRFATFTAAGFVRRGLESVGFSVTKERGFGRKRDMSVGVFTGDQITPAPPLSRSKKIAVIGGGVAGVSLATSFTAKKCSVSLFEKNDIAGAGSGNPRGLCNPRITALRGAESDFYAPAFAKVNALAKALSTETKTGYAPCGSLHLLTDETKSKRYPSFVREWDWHKDHARILDKTEASDIAGIRLQHDALFLPNAAMISPRLTARAMAEILPDIRHCAVTSLHKTDAGTWLINGEEFDAVVLCGGADMVESALLASLNLTLPLQKVRGQITRVRATETYRRLKTNLCYGGYSSVVYDDEVVIGSTFQHWLDDPALRPEDDAENIEKLSAVAPELAEGLTVIGSRASFRCAAKDRVPVIGAVSGQEGLFLSLAHGSHGILSGIMGAELLTSLITEAPRILPQSVEKHLSPQRFSRQ